MSNLSIAGERTSGQEVRTQNGVSAARGWIPCLFMPQVSAQPHFPSVCAHPPPIACATPAVTACLSVANVVKSSLGPVGLDKMLVDDLGEVTITNDGATILAQLEVEHPAAKVLVELSEMQDKEVGDGTTSVVILAAELLKRANELIKWEP